MKIDEEMRKTVGKRIREARKNKGLTLEKVAAMGDIDAKNLGKVERGEKLPQLPTLYRVWKATGLDIPQLLAELQEIENRMYSEESIDDKGDQR